MKVLQINSVCGIRSTGRICTDIAEVLEQNGHECRIAYGRETVPEKYEKYAVRISDDLHVKLDGIKTRIFDNAGFNSANTTRRFLEWVKEYDPDIIHLHNLHGYYIHIGLLFDFLKKSGKPVVWTLHDCWAFTGHCPHFDYAGCDKWKTQCFDCKLTREYPTSLLFDRSRKNYAGKSNAFCSVDNLHLVPVSEWIAKQKAESFLKSKPHTVIHNGIDLDRFKPTESAFREKHGIGSKRMYLGVASAWGTKKGLDAFVEISGMLHDDEIIVLVGLSDKQLVMLPKNIIGIKRTNSIEELAGIYSAADVFLNPTLEEALGLVNIEALACGVPVVTYKTGGSPECITEQSGIVVPRGDAFALLNAARSVSLSKEQIVQDAKRFDKNKKYTEYLDFYERCMCW